MLMNMKDLLAVAQKNHFAVPAFNIGSDQLLKSVMKTVKELNSPVILEMSPDEFEFVGYSQIQAMIYEAQHAPVPVCIHLDHGDSYKTVVKAIQAGMTSVMIDASKLPYEENVAITKKVVETAHIANVSVESELGTIGTTGNSIEGGTEGVIYTVPEEAKQFIEDTGIDTFACAIGTAHGIYPKDMKPELRIDILKDITKVVSVPLVLHGGSSNKDEEIAEAVQNGICKINISSDIKVAFYQKVRKTLADDLDLREPLQIYPEAMEACSAVCSEKIKLFNAQDKAKLYFE